MAKLIPEKIRLKNLFANAFLFQRKMHSDLRLRFEIKKKIKSNKQFKNVKKDKEYLDTCKRFLRKNFNGYKNTNWHHFYSTLSKIKKVEFIPEDLFYNRIEPTLSQNEFAPAIADKISLDTFFRKNDMPETIFKIINGRFYDANNHFFETEEALNKITKRKGRIILKPAADSGGGKNIIAGSPEKTGILFKSNRFLKDSFIIQEFVEQHKITAQFHPNSLNTLRIITARVDSDIVILSSFLRTGSNNSVVDNGHEGGIMCYINKNGTLNKYAVNNNAQFFEKHPDTGIKFEGVTIPKFDTLLNFCLENHKRFLRFTFIAWDMALREDGRLVFIEFNHRKMGINTHQILKGPLFGKYTDYFIDRYNKEKDKKIPPRFIM